MACRDDGTLRWWLGECRWPNVSISVPHLAAMHHSDTLSANSRQPSSVEMDSPSFPNVMLMKQESDLPYRQQPIITLGEHYLYRDKCTSELIEDEQVDFRPQSRGWILGKRPGIPDRCTSRVSKVERTRITRRPRSCALIILTGLTSALWAPQRHTAGPGCPCINHCQTFRLGDRHH